MIIGYREAWANQGDLFRAEDEVKVIVTQVSDVPEVRMTTTRQIAQQMNRGENRLTATAVANNLKATLALQAEWVVDE